MNIVGIKEGVLPVKYLGVPLTSKKLHLHQWQPLIDKITARMSVWTARFLSYAGRLQLIKSIVFSMQTYWSQLFVLPKSVITRIDQLCRVFLWTGKCTLSKRSLVAWDEVCKPKAQGGLGLFDTTLWNLAAVGKLLWALCHMKEKLWIKWVHAYYIKGRSVWQTPTPTRASWLIHKVLSCRSKLAHLNLFHQGTQYNIHSVYMMLREGQKWRPATLLWSPLALPDRKSVV